MSDPRPLVGRYRFGRRFEGARGAVAWFGIDEQTGAPVVVSLVPATRAYGLRRALEVRHPHLAAILEVVATPEAAAMPVGVSVRGDTAAVVAEHVAGDALYAKLKEGPLPRQDAVLLVSHLASAMAALHQKRVVHGSFSPLSVVIGRADRGVTPMMTQLLMPPLGAFASPERAQGEGASLVDDVWSMHATLYAALTGRAPLRLDSGQLNFEHASLAEFGVEDELLDRILEQGLAPSLETRTTKIEDLEAELVVWLSRQTLGGITAISARPRAKSTPAKGAIPEGLIRKPTLKGLDATAIAKALAKEKETEPPAPPAPELERDEPAAPPGDSAHEQPADLDERERSVSPVSLDQAPPPSPPPEPEPEPEPAPTLEAPAIASAAPSDHPAEAAAIEAAPPAPETSEAAPVPIVAAEPLPLPRSKSGMSPKTGALVGVLLAAALCAGLVWRMTPSTAAAPEPSASTVAGAPAHVPSPTAVALPADAPATAPSSSAASMYAPGDPSRCIAGYFPPGTFLSPQDLTPVCGTSDARGLIKTLYTRLVVAGAGNATPGMKEWAMLEWYELAAFAVMRGACCPGAPPISLPPSAPPCEPLGPTLDRLVEASAKHADVELRVLGFDKNVVCLMGQFNRPYRYTSHPYAGGQLAFSAFLKRNRD